jgi:hypothetical protein
MSRVRQPKFRPTLDVLEGRLCLSAADLLPPPPAPPPPPPPVAQQASTDLAGATDEAIVLNRNAGGKQEEYFKFIMSDVLVSSYQTGSDLLVRDFAAIPEQGADASQPVNPSLLGPANPADGDVPPSDQISLNFAQIKWEYKPQKAD